MYLIGIRYYNEMALFCLPKQSEYNINQEIKQVLKKKNHPSYTQNHK
jgi:hypothetical protein